MGRVRCEAMAFCAEALPVVGRIVRPIAVHVVDVDLAGMSRLETTALARTLLEG